MKVFRYDGAFAGVMGRAFDLVLLHLLWVVTSLPLVTIGASTAALYSVTLKMTKNEESYILRSYLKAFKSNFRKATGLWLFLALAFLWLLWLLRICMAGSSPGLLAVGLANAALLVLVGLAGLYVFPIQARYENTLKNIVKNSFVCSLRFLPYSLAMAGVIAVPILLTGFVEPLFPVMISLWIFGGSSLIAYANSFLLNRVFEKVEVPPRF